MGGGVTTHNSGQREVMLHHYVILSYYLGHYPRYRSTPYVYAYYPYLNLTPTRYHHHRSSGKPGLRSYATVMSKIVRVAIYWATVFWRPVT